MNTFARPRYSRSDFLDVERQGPGKHEFVDGQILAMAGARPRHNVVASNAISALRSRLRAPCIVCSSDQRVTIEATGASFYPSAVVVCGEWRVDEDGRGVTNPTLMVEVLSPTTEEYDRLEKLPQYKTVREVRDLLLVDHRTRTVEHHRRLQMGQWLVTELDAEGVIELATGPTFGVAELFADVDLAPP